LFELLLRAERDWRGREEEEEEEEERVNIGAPCSKPRYYCETTLTLKNIILVLRD
jgi:hypothetical protein